RALDDADVVSDDVAAELVTGRDLELERHAAPVGVAVGRHLVDDAIVVAGDLRAVLLDVPLFALLLLIAAGDGALVLPDPQPADVRVGNAGRGGRQRGPRHRHDRRVDDAVRSLDARRRRFRDQV